MRRIIIFGNSGSGKSTLAEAFRQEGLANLDLDTLAWLPSNPPKRRPLGLVYEDILTLIKGNDEWVVEGCYADLLALIKPYANEAIFMNLPVHLCQENARNRPWEHHKYESKEAQDKNLLMLLDWIAEYTERTDPQSYSAHRALYASFQGKKREVTSNQERHNKTLNDDTSGGAYD